eukprot:24450_1
MASSLSLLIILSTLVESKASTINVNITFPESICIGSVTFDEKHFGINAKYDLINNTNSTSHSLPAYYSNNCNHYLYPLTSNNQASLMDISDPIGTTYYVITNSITDLFIVKFHCIFDSALFSTINTFDFEKLCRDWQMTPHHTPTISQAQNGAIYVGDHTTPDTSFTSYSQCLQDIPKLCVSNSYHKFVDGEYEFFHWNYTMRGAVYHCSKCDNNGGTYIKPWVSSLQYIYIFSTGLTDAIIYIKCTLHRNEHNAKYIFNVSDCNNSWRYYHDHDWFHDSMTLSYSYTKCLYHNKSTVPKYDVGNDSNDEEQSDITANILIIFTLVMMFVLFISYLMWTKCSKTHKLEAEREQLAEELALLKQKKNDQVENGKDRDESKRCDVVQMLRVTDNIVVNEYVLVENGLKECFENSWMMYLERFKNESLTDDGLKLIQQLNDEQQDKYLGNVFYSIGDVLKFKNWLVQIGDLQQVEGK